MNIVQTDKLGIIARGKLDFQTEKIDLDWNTKPREGLGVSTSVVVNPFIKLGGTFARPALQLNPVRAAGTAGAAVATSGLTLWARGFWDRLTGELDLCAIALKKAAKRVGVTGTKTREKNESSQLHE